MHISLIAAITVDGFIARDIEQVSTEWTSREDKRFFREKTRQAGVVVMGRKTFDTIGKPLPDRLNIVYSRQEQISSHKNLRFTQSSPGQLIKELKQQDYSEVMICGGASIYTMFMQSGLVSKLYLTTEPVLFGKGISLFNQDLDLKLRINKTYKLSDKTFVQEYLI